MASCSVAVPDLNASGDSFYTPLITKAIYESLWQSYGFNAKYWEGWGLKDALNPSLAMARAFNACYALSYSAEDYENDGYETESALHWGRRWVYKHVDDLRAMCGDNTAVARTEGGHIDAYLQFFYTKTVPERASTLVHEATHVAGIEHNAFFPAGSNRRNPPDGSKQADDAWGKNAYTYQAAWLAGFADRAIRTTSAMRALALAKAIDITANCFASQNGVPKFGGPRTYGFGPAVESLAPNRLDIFGRGTGADMLHNVWSGGPNWLGWNADMGTGTFSSGPAVASWGPKRLDAFALGTDRRMYHNAWGGGAGWSGWKTDMGPGTFTSPPAASSWGPNRLDVFALGDDGRMFHNAWDGGPWSGWKADLGDGQFSSGPAVASWGKGRLDVFALGLDRRMFHNAWNDGPKWSGWNADTGPGTFSSAPAVTSWAPNRLDVFAVWDDWQMAHNVWDGGPKWSGWNRDTGPGTFSSAPAVASWGPNRLDVFSLGFDRRVYHNAWAGGPAWRGWEADTGAATFM